MTLQQLQYLMEVYKTGSVSGAARNLFLAQSSLSASISSLENELGFPVFIRSKNGMTPTAQGSHVIEQAARICNSYQAMMDAAATEREHLRISAPCYEPLNNAFAELVRLYKGDASVCFSINDFTSVQAAKKLADFELEVAVLMNHKARFFALQTLLESKGLQWKQLKTVPVVMQIGPGHSMYHLDNLTPEHLSQELFIDNANDPLVDNEFLKGVIRLSADRTVSVKSTHTRNLLVAKGLGYTIGVGAPQSDADAYGFRSIPLSGVSYALNIVTNPKRPLSKAAMQYIHLVEQALKD